MDDSTVARDLTAVIAEEIEAQLGVHLWHVVLPGATLKA
jgi:hypothetical protein